LTFQNNRNFLYDSIEKKSNSKQNLIDTIMKQEYISEFAWSKILQFLRGCSGVYIVSESRCRRFIEAIFWMSRTGAQWRELNERYGNWSSVYKRFNAWSKKKIWCKLLKFCADNPDLEYIMLDATIIRAHACSAGYGDQMEEGLGRSKGGFTSKIHAKVDALGNPLEFIITPGQRSDCTQAKALLQNVSNSAVIADKAYDSNEIRQQIADQHSIAIIPPRSNRIELYEYDKHIYKERHAIECFFGKIKHFRRIFSRFDKSARNFKAFLSFVAAILWLR
jgi:transposase